MSLLIFKPHFTTRFILPEHTHAQAMLFSNANIIVLSVKNIANVCQSVNFTYVPESLTNFD